MTRLKWDLLYMRSKHQCREWNSIMCRDVKLDQLGSKIMKEYPPKIIGSFWVKVMNSPIYSIQREVIKEFEYLKSQLYLLHCVFIKNLLFFLSFSQMTAIRKVCLYKQWSLEYVFIKSVISLLCMIHDFRFKAYYCLCFVSYFKET